MPLSLSLYLQAVTHDQDMKVKDRQIKILEDKLRIAEKARQDSGEGGSRAMRELETHCLLLQQQVIREKER